MKKKNLLLMVVVCLLLSSCGDEPSALSIRSVYQTEGIDSLLCTGDNIEWFNGTTGEIKFKKLPYMHLGMPPLRYHYLVIFLNDNELIRFATTTSISSYSYDHPCITEGNRTLYISKCYPHCDYCESCKRPEGVGWDDFYARVDENWKAIEPEWNIFIKQLKKEGRYRE